MEKTKDRRVKTFLTIALTVVLTSLAFPIVLASTSEGSFFLSNSPPDMQQLDNITGVEGALVTLNPAATDINNDPITFYYSGPFNESGQWQSVYGDGGVYQITVYASDGIDNSTQDIVVKLSPYCGDGVCNHDRTESCSNCAEDCGNCPPAVIVKKGSGSGGARIVEVPIVVKEPAAVPAIEQNFQEEQDDTEPVQVSGAAESSTEATEDVKQNTEEFTGSRIELDLLESKIAVKDDKIRFKLEIENFEAGENIKISYIITPIDDDTNKVSGAAIYDEFSGLINSAEVVHYFEEDIVLLSEDIKLVREIAINDDVAPGKYEIHVIAKGTNNVVQDTKEFIVKKGKISIPGIPDLNTKWLFVFGACGIIVIFIIKRVKKTREVQKASKKRKNKTKKKRKKKNKSKKNKSVKKKRF